MKSALVISRGTVQCQTQKKTPKVTNQRCQGQRFLKLYYHSKGLFLELGEVFCRNTSGFKEKYMEKST